MFRPVLIFAILLFGCATSIQLGPSPSWCGDCTAEESRMTCESHIMIYSHHLAIESDYSVIREVGRPHLKAQEHFKRARVEACNLHADAIIMSGKGITFIEEPSKWSDPGRYTEKLKTKPYQILTAIKYRLK